MNSEVKPISPKEIAAHKAVVFPSFVLSAFNELIAERFTDGRAVVLQKDAVNLIRKKAAEQGVDLEGISVYSKGWLNVEEIYREQGWKVVYDKPAYFESYEANFTFREK